MLVARDDPLDTYLVHHPEALFGQPVEATVLDPANPYVLGAAPVRRRGRAAADRRPTCALFGAGAAAACSTDLVERGLLRRRPTGWYWTRAGARRDLADLRGTGGAPVARRRGGHRPAARHGRRAARRTCTVHAGAVYLHQGETYLVDDLDLDERVRPGARAEPDWTTHRPRRHRRLRCVGAARYARRGSASTLSPRRRCEVTNQVVSYQRRRLATGEVLGEEPLDLPPRAAAHRAVWWTVSPRPAGARPGWTAADVPGALHAAEHAAIGLLPLFATCDRWDIGGVSTALHPDTGRPTVFVYDGHPGGAGFAERGLRARRPTG